MTGDWRRGWTAGAVKLLLQRSVQWYMTVQDGAVSVSQDEQSVASTISQWTLAEFLEG